MVFLCCEHGSIASWPPRWILNLNTPLDPSLIWLFNFLNKMHSIWHEWGINRIELNAVHCLYLIRWFAFSTSIVMPEDLPFLRVLLCQSSAINLLLTRFRILIFRIFWSETGIHFHFGLKNLKMHMLKLFIFPSISHLYLLSFTSILSLLKYKFAFFSSFIFFRSPSLFIY